MDALTEDLRELSVETEGRRAGGSSSRSSRLIAEYMDVVSLCHMDAAMTGRAERRRVAEALKNLSLCRSTSGRTTLRKQVQGLKWFQLRRIMLQGFQLEKVVYEGASVPRELRFKPCACLVTATSLPSWRRPGPSPGWTLRTSGQHPLIYASGFGLKEVVAALIEAEETNVQNNRGVTLFVASQKGHLEVVKELLRGGSRQPGPEGRS